MKNVLLIYGHPLSRCALKALVDAEHALHLGDETDCASDAILKIRQQTFDAVILDVSSPQSNGLETFCDLRHACPDEPILIINGSTQTDRMHHFMQLGCAGYLAYTAGRDHVLPAIQAITRGQRYVIPPPQAASRSMLHEHLSLRELQIFLKLIKGQAVNAVATELNIAPGSVSVFRAKILKKMNVPNNAALIHYAMTHALIPITGRPQGARMAGACLAHGEFTRLTGARWRSECRSMKGLETTNPT